MNGNINKDMIMYPGIQTGGPFNNSSNNQRMNTVNSGQKKKTYKKQAL